jgi:hypothetical protein
MARKVGRFCQVNNITHCEVIGGEFFCNPDWLSVITEATRGMRYVRLVTNGDWAGNKETAEQVISWLTNLGVDDPIFALGISNDRWHTNRHVEEAARLLKEADLPYKLAGPGDMPDDGLVPIGRHKFEYTFFSMMGCWCHEPERKYTMLIDEVGEIYKCQLGAWPYDNIENYQDGGWSARFKEFNSIFYGCWLSNCASCQRQEEESIILDLAKKVRARKTAT